MPEYLLDACALLAFLNDEEGGGESGKKMVVAASKSCFIIF